MDWSNPVGSAASGLIGGAFGLLAAKKNYEYSSKLAAQQNQFNLDMWKMQADYNSPAAQMKRFEQAGLNPNLIYGQGSSGNMSSAPEQVTPSAPDFSRAAQEASKIGHAFNVEGLRTQIANRKKAQAEARIAKTNADRNEMEFDADKVLGAGYTFDDKTGKYVPALSWSSIDNINASNYYVMKRRAENFGRVQLIPVREGYLNAATGLFPYRQSLLGAQTSYLQPQIQMLQYEQKYKPYSFWIDHGTKVLNSLPLPRFNFRFNRNSGSPLSTTYRNEYRYAPQTNYINNHSPF